MTVSTRPLPPAPSGRASLAVGALTLTNRLSRALGRGSGTVVGGRVGLLVDPSLVASLARGRPIALVSGTNGKTTTTRLLVAALTAPGRPAIATNVTGANMPAGHAAALAGSAPGVAAVLEVDEGYLGRLVEEAAPQVVILLNLSRDQLDRISEVRMVVDRWRAALAGPTGAAESDGPHTVVVANADDPMVVWAAGTAADVRWVGAGQVWHNDAVGCPACGGGIVFDPDGAWACDRCDFARPSRHAWLDGADLVTADGERWPVAIGLPGHFNRSNAAMVAIAASLMGGADRGASDGGASDRDHLDGALAPALSPGLAPALSPGVALERMAAVSEVEGRFSATTWKGRPVRLLLAKNPAGWTAIFDLLDEYGSGDSPVVLSINARTADGADTSWLWDVPFERLAGRPVVATGDRRLDLAVRLRYAEVSYTVSDDPLEALDQAVGMGRSPVTGASGSDPGSDPERFDGVEFLGNYTAFADLRGRL